MPGLFVEKLSSGHICDSFDCGTEALDRFLARHALQAQNSNASITYVACDDHVVVGYYTLVYGHVAPDEAPARLLKGQARHPVPVMVLARLAVSSARQGQGLGAALLKDALLRTLQAADIAGLRAFLVHAKDDGARAFYEHFNFVPSPTDPLHLFLLLKDLKALLGRS